MAGNIPLLVVASAKSKGKPGASTVGTCRFDSNNQFRAEQNNNNHSSSSTQFPASAILFYHHKDGTNTHEANERMDTPNRKRFPSG